ncbi:MAG: hypothetical protein OI74_12390 [Gammaproteobacteria bacterium (ex Lamellibrachia satsuma)]|nr:MAG: DUF4124 domain-containing protein [Gammaproteobacteria bacterium (ex Lamellibrachia satsuma)]RRS32127.1 MAG: hypothetical protein OI74_12390 [Gammaproteobacteria bacterium (ex Lamellibrachia satsuma)]RRS34278.1 MAG: hypothetical protein NV67_13380 [Gammaproteobacteria bacterium (ex Lamellibrachia satsuma)]
MVMIKHLLFCLLLLPVFSVAYAETVYRSVDESGQVTYSDAPGKGRSDMVKMPSGPSEEAKRETQAREKEIRDAANKAGRQRQSGDQQRAVNISEAERNLQAAEARLGDAKILRDEDRQSTAGGGRRIRPEYFERIKQEEAAVEAARKTLQQARNGR